MTERTEMTEMTEPIPLRPSGSHPTPEEIYRARSTPDDPAAGRVLHHAAGCALCSAEMARQEAFDRPEPLPAAALDRAWERFGRGEPAVRRPFRRTPVLSLAATLTACLLGLGIWIAERGPGPSEVERGSAEATAGWAPSGTLAAAPAEFTFPDPGDGPRRVKVFDAAQTYVWTSEPAFGGRIAFPAAERQRLRPGVQYFWTVVGGAGEEAAAQSFRIRLPAPRRPRSLS